MGTLGASLLLPTKPLIIAPEKKGSQFVFRERSSKNRSFIPVARLFGPSIFEASKLKVLFLGVDEEKHPGKLPRTYTLTHSDITSKITLAISQTINSSQVLKAFVHGDGNLLKNHPELQESLVWVYFHSIIQEFNRVECWGPLKEAASPPPPPPQPSIAADGGTSGGIGTHTEKRSLLSNWEIPQPCHDTCSCCFPSTTSIPWTASSYSSRAPLGPLGTNDPIKFR
ncbi:PREDICTED: protein STAY-GREEN 1, chloroplastic-like isoform X2 [Ipomoea nil]|uniref:protein STAY-GREEN 1, chloroplastic-like isoform X2 n=1 Tax=Ipomoea nil TaxID=35883 RepID=UPI000901ADC0|nr:PREDICTED: protein STAY-GREEN 1, chloroplastic-like isoform X2 [Ipomoea nil]